MNTKITIVATLLATLSLNTVQAAEIPASSRAVVKIDRPLEYNVGQVLKFMKIIGACDVPALKTALDQDANPNCISAEGVIPLTWVIDQLSLKQDEVQKNSLLSMIDLLIEYGADVNVNANGREFPLMHCFSYLPSNPKLYNSVIKKLLKAGAELGTQDVAAYVNFWTQWNEHAKDTALICLYYNKPIMFYPLGPIDERARCIEQCQRQCMLLRECRMNAGKALCELDPKKDAGKQVGEFLRPVPVRTTITEYLFGQEGDNDAELNALEESMKAEEDLKLSAAAKA
jgi:hypothetical protein